MSNKLTRDRVLAPCNLALLLLAASATAQTPETPLPSEPEATATGDVGYADVRAPDGSRFVLVATGGPPIVHWVCLTPAGVVEDPPGLEGLSFAVARAAMTGTSFGSSIDSTAEWEALVEQDKLEQQWDSLRARKKDVSETLFTDLLRIRSTAASHVDPIAWERELRQAPALGTELLQIPEANLLHVTTLVEGLPRVAQLIVERREGTVLRGVHREFRIVRAEQERERGSGSEAKMRRELLGLSFLGHPFARAYSTTDGIQPISRAEALEVFQRTHHPERTVHVLTGGFNLDEMQMLIGKLFSKTSYSTAPTPTRLPPSSSSVARRSSIADGVLPSVTIGAKIPPGTDPGVLAVLVRWLTDGLDAELTERLRARGHVDVVVSGIAPFPVRTGGLVLIEVTDPAPRAGGAELSASVEASLDAALEEGPSAKDIWRAYSRYRSAAAASRLGARNLAFHLAISCGLDGRTPEEASQPVEAVAPATVHELARQLLPATNRTIVNLEVKQ